MATGTFNATKDLYLSSLSQERDLQTGAMPQLLLEYYQYAIETWSRRILLQFDFSTIAKGSTVQAATLVLNKILGPSSSSYVNAFNAYRMTFDGWTEAASWHYQNGANLVWPESYTTANPATGARGDFDPTSSISVTPNTVMQFAGVLKGWIEDAINFNDGILSIYIFQASLPGPISSSPIRFSSEEHTTENPPLVNVVWTPPSYGLTITYNDAAAGNVTVTSTNHDPFVATSGETYYFQNGEVVTLTVNTNGGYGFSNWTGADSGDVSGADPDFSITMDAAKAIQANWAVTTYRLIVNEGTNGTDTPAPSGSAPLHTYDVDSTVGLVWAPDAGYQLDSLTFVQGDTPSDGAIAPVQAVPKDNYNILVVLTIDQLKEITSTYKALHTMTPVTAGGANGTVTWEVSLGSLGWDQYPKFAYFDKSPYGGDPGGFYYFIRAVPNVGYTVQVTASTGTIEKWLQSVPFGVDDTYYKFTPADADSTITVTWVAIHADQATGGPWQKPWNDESWRIH